MANYYMLGGDGKEYGPVTTEQLRQWLTEKRANAKTQIRADKSANWLALGTVPEFIAPMGAPDAGAGPMAGTTPGNFAQGTTGQSDAAVKRIATALAASGGSMRGIAILLFIFSAIFIFQTIGLGLLIAWLPIWMGIILNRAASQAKRAAASGSEADIIATLEHMRSFFRKSSGTLLIMLFLTLIGLILLSFFLSKMGNMMNVPGL
jgi:hypothetical protein